MSLPETTPALLTIAVGWPTCRRVTTQLRTSVFKHMAAHLLANLFGSSLHLSKVGHVADVAMDIVCAACVNISVRLREPQADSPKSVSTGLMSMTTTVTFRMARV